jgi:plasmid stabilization system protein ParE
MMYEVIWLPAAMADLERHFAFLDEKNPDAASRAVRTITSAAGSLTVSPQRGVASADPSQRKLRVFFGKYGYVLYYRIEADRVFILRVHHGREHRP